MPGYAVELIGVAREVYYVEADSEDQARERWHEGILEISETSSMEVVSVREED
jgi:hypothetical protein